MMPVIDLLVSWQNLFGKRSSPVWNLTHLSLMWAFTFENVEDSEAQLKLFTLWMVNCLES